MLQRAPSSAVKWNHLASWFLTCCSSICCSDLHSCAFCWDAFMRVHKYPASVHFRLKGLRNHAVILMSVSFTATWWWICVPFPGIRSWNVDLKSCDLSLYLRQFLSYHTASFKGVGKFPSSSTEFLDPWSTAELGSPWQQPCSDSQGSRSWRVGS